MLDAARIRQQLADFALAPLFIEELGWDRYAGRLDVTVDGQVVPLEGIAEKRGMVAFATTADELPDRPTRRKIEQQAARSVHEHLIVYLNRAKTAQLWQWVRREPGRPAAVRPRSVGSAGCPPRGWAVRRVLTPAGDVGKPR